ncbi:MAG: PAS domain-containing protein [Gemmatimonadetes bacterium]|nr:PAS domain-containing protein [Gemmatimonadota bacterium]
MSLDTTTRMLAPFLDGFGPEELDRIPFGIIRLDADGVVQACNRAEVLNANYPQPVVGRRFFTDVAPSARTPEFHGRFLQAFAQERFDETFAFTFACGAMPRRVLVRMYFAGRTDSLWVFTARPDGSALGLRPFDDYPPRNLDAQPDAEAGQAA